MKDNKTKNLSICLPFCVLVTGMISAQDAYSELKASKYNNFVHQVFLRSTIDQRIYSDLLAVEPSLK